MKKQIFSLLFGLLLVLLTQGCEKTLPRLYATVLPEPKPLPEFNLVAHDGTTFSRQHLMGQWSYLFFGFTRCPDVCPTTLMTLQQATEQMRAAGITEPAKVVFISVDAEFDTPDAIQHYLQKFDPSFGGASGVEAEIKKLTQSLGAAYSQNANAGNVAMIEHTGAIFVINPQGELRALYTPPHSVQHIADDAAHLLDFER